MKVWSSYRVYEIIYREGLQYVVLLFVYTMSQVDKRARTQLSIWRMYIIELISEMLYEVYRRVGVSLLDL